MEISSVIVSLSETQLWWALEPDWGVGIAVCILFSLNDCNVQEPADMLCGYENYQKKREKARVDVYIERGKEEGNSYLNP